MTKEQDKALVRALRRRVNNLNDNEAAHRRDYNRLTVMWVVIVLLAALLLRCFVFQNTMVQGDSMYPNYFDGEQVLVEKLTYLLREPQRGEVIICRYDDTGDAMIKRVIGLPGETVEVRDGAIYIDGEALDESAYWNDYIVSDMAPVTVPEDHVFVVGDNRNWSLDSRAVGPVPYYRIIGKAMCIIWPFEDFGRPAE